jgi:segregation and condensation protein B
VNEPLSNPEDRQPGPGEDVSAPHGEAPGIETAWDETDAVERAESGAEGPDTRESAPATPVPAGSGDVVAPEAAAEEDEGEEEQAPVWIPEPDKLLLSLLFASHEYLDARSLREIMGPEWDTPRLRQLVRKLNRDLDGQELPFEITETEGTFRLRTLPKFYPWTRKLFKDSAPRRLSQAALETLAIVAYKQPVTKAEIESIRGVNVDGSMKTLLDKRLIDIGRRSDALGQAFTYHTTRDFMRYFGISRVPDDLPRLSEFEGILNAQSLIPQMGPDGEVHEVARDDEAANGEQLSLGMDSNEMMNDE